MADRTEQALRQIDRALTLYEEARARSQYDDISDLDDAERQEVEIVLDATLDRLAPGDSPYLKSKGQLSQWKVGSLKALRRDYADGHLESIEQLLRSDLFADFLEMAEHLLDEGYKDPSAVLVGGVLEEHLRSLCHASAIAVNHAGKPKKVDAMNADLARDGIYNKLDQKSVTSWLDLRNKAAHGKYDEYSTEQVRLFLSGVRDFIGRTAA